LFKHSNAPGFGNMDLNGKDIEPAEQRGGGYHLDLIADFACAFIKRHSGQPFFFYLAPRAPHTPLDAPPKYTARFPGAMPERRRQALAMISAVDDGVGRILATLRDHKLEERTLIFFMGDNGAPLKIHKMDSPLDGDPGGWDGSLNEPMNGEKGMLSEGGIRVPWLNYWKGTIPGGQVYPHPVISLDIAATAVSLAGLKTQPGELDGVNLIPFFTGENKAAPHERLFWRWTTQSAIREGKWKLLSGGLREYLYDLEADPGEKQNSIGQHSAIARRLRDQLKVWAADLQPPGVESNTLSRAATAYFDYYLESKPAAIPDPAQKSGDRGVRREERKKRLETRNLEE
jgi:arylsulfatase A-like enzyme